MPTIVYLDPEDEITSAASRIRQARESRVALVVPFGSRVATSRINFRLLAREAMASGRRLDIVAPDASARALAASAGIPVFASIGEYETALEDGTRDGADGARAVPPAVPATALPHEGPTRPAAAPARVPPAAPGIRGTDPAVAPVPEPPARRRRRPGPALVAGLLLLLLAAAFAGVAAFLLLPAAEITVTPRIVPLGPIDLSVRADPEATAVDAEARVIPAEVLEIPVEARAEFPATGRRVEETTAGGTVRWSNCDPSDSYRVPQGTAVRASDGTAFTTDEALFLPVAVLTGDPDDPRLECTASEVRVTAAEPGPRGNVPAGAIRVVPARYDRTLVRVTNPEPTAGGTRRQFPRVSQKDVAAAMEQLTLDIGARFAGEVENPDRVPPGTTVFPDTAVLGEPVPLVDPASLVGLEAPSFSLALAATGTVLAVDASPVAAIAEERLLGSLAAGHRLVDGSIEVEVGEGTVVGGTVTFPVSGVARQVRPVDPAALEAQVLGRSAAEARALLEPYGTVEIVLWPDWARAIPSLDERVTLTVRDPEEAAPSPAEPGGSPGRTPSPPASPGTPGTPSPGAASTDGAEGEPLPSG